VVLKNAVLRYPVLFWPLDPDPGSGMGKNPDLVSRMTIPDNFSEKLETVFRVKNTEIL
jgi:hypothetical protein